MKNIFVGLSICVSSVACWSVPYETAGISLGEAQASVVAKIKAMGYDVQESSTYVLGGKDTGKTYWMRFVADPKRGQPISLFVQFGPVSGNLVALKRTQSIEPPTGSDRFRADVIAKYGEPDNDASSAYMQWDKFTVAGGPKGQTPNECAWNIPLANSFQQRKSRCGSTMMISGAFGSKPVSEFRVDMADQKAYIDEIAEALKSTAAKQAGSDAKANANPGPKL